MRVSEKECVRVRARERKRVTDRQSEKERDKERNIEKCISILKENESEKMKVKFSLTESEKGVYY